MDFVKWIFPLPSRCTHPTRSGGRTADSRSVVWWCWGWGRRHRCKIPHRGSRERAPGWSSPPSTPGGPASVQPARTLGVALPSCQQKNHTPGVSDFLAYRPKHADGFLWQEAPDQWSNTAEIRVVDLLKVRLGLPICETFALENIKPLPLRLRCYLGYKDKVYGYS